MSHFIDSRNKFYIQKKLFCNILHNIDVFPGVNEFLNFIDEKRYEISSDLDVISGFY